MTRAATIYTYALAANATVQLPVDGGFYKLLAASGAVGIARNGNAALSLDPGQGERENFQFLTITDKSGATNNVELIVADSSFVDDRIYGEVSIDGGKARALLGLLYVGMPLQASLAANYPYVQLWNPPGSGKNLIVMQTSFGSAGALNAVMGYGTVARTTDLTATYAKSKKQGVPIGVGQIRAENNVAGLAAPFFNIKAIANQSQQWTPAGPLIVPPGVGVDVYNNALASDLFSTWEWYEEKT